MSFCSEHLHSVRGCPKQAEKTSSENITFEMLEHPYRTCGSSGWFFLFFDFPIFDQKPIIPFVAVPKKSKKRQAKTQLCHFRSENLYFVRGCPKKVEKTSSENTTFEISEHPYRTCGFPTDFFFFFDFLFFDQKPIIPFVAVPNKSKKRQAKTRFLHYVSFLS